MQVIFLLILFYCKNSKRKNSASKREHFSVTFFYLSSCSRAQRTLLCYLFSPFLLLSGTENASLLPFPAFPLVLGHRERFSVTFSRFSSCSRAQRTLLCYLFPPFLLLSGTENASLLPLHP